MRVELDIYSGRPNPSWAFDPAQRSELSRRLGELSPAGAAAPAGEALGYRGLVVTGAAGEGIDPFTRIVVWNGVVSCEGAGGSRVLVDPGRALERWLLETGRGHLEPDLFDWIDEMLRSAPGF
ncbi:MAG: hypothetical protein IT372_25845 [Polyangiaceae bacterium]|nr:hypothetical protein [Polyangiaceae bacterium]